jgi:hypothetical protein
MTEAQVFTLRLCQLPRRYKKHLSFNDLST